MLDPVASTGLLVAAIRAEEHLRADRLFEDPFAARLAGDGGRELLDRYRNASPGGAVPVIEVRTRWYDEGVARAAAANARQFVILAAGMDSASIPPRMAIRRASLRGRSRRGPRTKTSALAGETPRCERIAVGADLAGHWASSLVAAGFDAAVPTTWLVEGLLQYLPASAVASLFLALDGLSAARSTVLYDVVGRSLLDAPLLRPAIELMERIGAPWIFGSDDPASLVAPHGWDAVVTEPGIVGNALGRWPFPAVPARLPGIPRGYLVDAKKPARYNALPGISDLDALARWNGRGPVRVRRQALDTVVSDRSRARNRLRSPTYRDQPVTTGVDDAKPACVGAQYRSCFLPFSRLPEG